jgi:MoxR-like ATPase
MDKQQFTHPIESLEPVADHADLIMLQNTVKTIFVDKLVRQYIAVLVEATRQSPSIYLGSSPRGSLALFRTAQARALMQEREFVLPDDIKALAEPVLAHRLVLHSLNGSKDRSGRANIAEILEKVPVPGVVP